MTYKNYMEDVVDDVYEEFKKRYPSYCICERCATDTKLLALTKLKGKYAASLQGEVFARLSREDRQVRADVLLVVIEAANMVAKQPNH